MDIKNTDLKRSNRAELWIRLLFWSNWQKFLICWGVTQSNLQNAANTKSFNWHIVESRWTKLAVCSNIGLRKLFNRSELCLAFYFHFTRWPQMVLWAMNQSKMTASHLYGPLIRKFAKFGACNVFTSAYYHVAVSSFQDKRSAIELAILLRSWWNITNKKLCCYTVLTYCFLPNFKVIDIRPMAPVLNTGPLEGIWARNVKFCGKESNY